MRSTEFISKIRAAWHFAYDELSIGQTVSSVHSLKVNKVFNAIALDENSSYKEIYLSAVSLSYYNFMFEDYAILQFSWESERSWRLAYLPNPWITGVVEVDKKIQAWEKLELSGEIDAEETTDLMSGLSYFGSVPPIRFEFAPSEYKEISHPAAHLHIGRHTENRWPLSRIMNPLTFTMFIAKLYYTKQWNIMSAFHSNVEERSCLDMKLIRELQNCQVVSEFSDNERRSLHISSF